jgi:hypothetical protein
MQVLNAAPWFKELLANRQPPCISVYLPAQMAAAPDNQMPAHFRNALDEVREQLDADASVGATGAPEALRRLQEAMSDDTLWEGRRTAIAFFASADYSQVIELRQAVERLVVIADSFHVKPLIRTMQVAQPFHVLCVAPRSVRLFEGDSFGLTEVELSGVPRSVDDALATASTSGKEAAPAGHVRSASTATGDAQAAPGSVPTDRFFRMVDQAIWQRYSRRDHLPVVVAADVQYLSAFLDEAKNDYIVKEGIKLNPEAATPERLREEASRILEPQYQRQIQTLKDAFQAARARRLGSDEIPQVAEAAAVGRVGTLLVDSDAKVPGILHRDSGLIEHAGMSDSRADDILDDLAEMVLKTDGQVFVVPHDQMPTDAGVAAVYRY